MQWEGLNLHIENLVPGIATLSLTLALLPSPVIESVNQSAVSTLTSNSFIVGGAFISTSYLIGIFSSSICRCIIDPISAAGPRAFMFRKFYPDLFKEKDNSAVNKAYRAATQKGLDSQSEYKRTEMKNRRERGRLLSSGTLPIALFILWATGNYSVWTQISLLFLFIDICIFLYAYAELTIFQESLVGETT